MNQGSKKREKERASKVEAFMADYKELSKKHGIDISPSLNITQAGITPVVRFVELEDKGTPEK